MRKNRKSGQKLDSNSGKIWLGKVGQNPFCLLVYTVFNLRIGVEEVRLHQTWPECASNWIRAIFKNIQCSDKLSWKPPPPLSSSQNELTTSLETSSINVFLLLFYQDVFIAEFYIKSYKIKYNKITKLKGIPPRWLKSFEMRTI